MMRPTSQTDMIPHYARLAWGLAERPPQEVKSKRLNTYKVVKGAIEVADNDGLAAVTIRNLSKHLGFTTMAVYRHIDSRDELLLLMFETGLGRAPEMTGATWQESLREWGAALVARYQEHAWLLDIPDLGVPTMPNHISWVEQSLIAMRDCNISDERKLDVTLLIDGHARNIAGLMRPPQKVIIQHSIEAMSWLRPMLSPVAPLFSQAITEAIAHGTGSPEFAYGLDLIISGIELSLKEN